MDKKELLKKLRDEFRFLENETLGVVLFGSKANDKFHSKSDLDICIIAPKVKPSEIIPRVFRKLDVFGKNYDVYSFEELPLYLKIQVINNNEIIFSKDKYALSEYFYFFRKLWEDQEHRNELKKEKILELM